MKSFKSGKNPGNPKRPHDMPFNHSKQKANHNHNIFNNKTRLEVTINLIKDLWFAVMTVRQKNHKNRNKLMHRQIYKTVFLL
jgi:hypothetical protein